MANQGSPVSMRWTNQGGTAKLKLSPLNKGGSFLFSESNQKV